MNPTQTGTLIALGVLAALFFCTTAYFWSKYEDEKAEYAILEAEHRENFAELVDTKRRMNRVLLAVTPLVEKTDWMTGRWGGRFHELQRLENARNRSVDLVRKDLMDLQSVRDIGFAAFDPLPEHVEHKVGPLSGEDPFRSTN